MIKPVLSRIGDQFSREGLVVLLLNSKRLVVAATVAVGSRDDCPYPLTRVLDAAARTEATQAIFGRSHPAGTRATPSEADIENAAALHFALREAGVALVDDLVLCSASRGRELRSVKATARFRELLAES